MLEFQFDSLGDFFAMGGDAPFVWFSYGMFAAFIAWNLIQPRIQRRKIARLLQARRQREARQQAAREHAGQ